MIYIPFKTKYDESVTKINHDSTFSLLVESNDKPLKTKIKLHRRKKSYKAIEIGELL